MPVSASSSKENGSAAAMEDIRQDLQTLKDDIGHLADEVTDLLSSKGYDALDEARDKVRLVRQNIDDAIAEAGSKGREAANVMQNAAANAADAIEESLKTRPLTTLGIAMALGFFFGATWRR